MLDILQFNAPMPYKIYTRRERHVETCYRDICLVCLSLSLSLSSIFSFCLSVRFPYLAILNSLNHKFPFDFDAAKVQGRRWGKISPILTPEIFQGSFVDTAKGSHNTPQVSTVSCCVGEFYPVRNVFQQRLTIERN